MISQEERKLLNAISANLTAISDDAESAGDVIAEIRQVIHRARGPAGQISEATRVALRQKAARIKDHLANSTDTIENIVRALEEF